MENLLMISDRRRKSSTQWRTSDLILGWNCARWRIRDFVSWNSTSTLVILILLLSLSNLSEECPASCECGKWKNGKESVVCSSKARLRSIPAELDLPGTQVLDVSGNLIEELPKKVFLICNLLNLQKIFLSECQLQFVDKEAFAKLSNLMELDLSGNKLKNIPSDSFESIPELRELKLNSNPLTILQNNAFYHLPRLVRLELTGCWLERIETWAFRGLSALQWLYLDNNRLFTVQPESFLPLRSLHELIIHENPWNCSCVLQPWRDWMLKSKVSYRIPPSCSSPRRLIGISWSQLKIEEFACLPFLTSSSDQQKIIRIVEGENASLECRVLATPDTQVQWLNGNKGGSLVTNGSMGTTSAFVLTESFVCNTSDEFSDGASCGYSRKTGSGTSDRSLGFKISKLTLIRATMRDAGIFICQAYNPAGTVSSNLTITVIQAKSDNRTGRLLFTGTLIAVLLLCVICIILCGIIVVNHRGRNLRALVEEKIELNHVPVLEQNGETSTVNVNTNQRNGGVGNHTYYNQLTNHKTSMPNNSKKHNISSGNNSKARERIQFKPLSTEDPDNNFSDTSEDKLNINDEDRSDGWGMNEPDRKRKKIPQELPRRTTEFQPLSLALATSTMSSQTPVGPRMGLEEVKDQNLGVGMGTSCFGSSHPSNHASVNSMHHQPSQRDKFPDLLSSKASMDLGTLPRSHRYQESAYRRNGLQKTTYSESQSPLLSHSSYGSSFEGISESKRGSASSVATGNPYTQISGRDEVWPKQRLSMPTSPTHEDNQSLMATCSSYDYHAAQLALFLEEYRELQVELMKMSASLSQVDCNPSSSRSPHVPNTNPPKTSFDPSQNPILPFKHNLGQLPPNDGILSNGVQLPQYPNNSTSWVLKFPQAQTNQQNQLKSILKNSANSNYSSS